MAYALLRADSTATYATAGGTLPGMPCRLAPLVAAAVLLFVGPLRAEPDAAAPPRLLHIAPVAPDILELTIQAGEIPPVEPVLYEGAPGDERVPGEATALAWSGGQQGVGELVVVPEAVEVYRSIGGQRTRIGTLAGDGQTLLPAERVVGAPLNEAVADDLASYAIARSGQDVEIVAVFRKSKPNNQTAEDRSPAMLHRVYLKLAEPLELDGTYTVRLAPLGLDVGAINYTHDSLTRSEAIHASQIGHGPGDEHKVAYLSTWLGTGGGLSYDDYGLGEFELIDASGAPVFSGPIEKAKGVDEPEQLKTLKNYPGTAVYRMDYSAFDRPGTYRVRVPGIGTSGTIVVGGGVWTDAFQRAMKGLLHHRSGLALEAPWASFTRPRSFHPADGMKVFSLDIHRLGNESAAVNAELTAKVQSGEMPPTLDDAWGGYMDAGDWDRRSQHLSVTHGLLELYELFPTFFDEVALALPPDEAGNAVPDLLDEALWNLDFYLRLQEDDGGVRGGIESTAHPRAAETSWQESLAVGAFAADPASSYWVAACAAKASRLLPDGERYAQAAHKAWEWAEANRDRPEFEAGRQEILATRVLAAAELLAALAPEADASAFEDAYVAARAALGEDEGNESLAAAFTYTRLPEGRGSADRKAADRALIVRVADRAVAFGAGNSFGLTTPFQGMPVFGYVGYFSTPGIGSHALARAHVLTGDAKYRRAMLRSSDVAAGANPDNTTFTIGLGWQSPAHPLHIDSRRSGQAAPEGTVVYGPGDPEEDWQAAEWMHRWFLSKQATPDSRTWPAHESYYDVYLWPITCEYTVHQTIGPAAYEWGYLAATAP